MKMHYFVRSLWMLIFLAVSSPSMASAGHDPVTEKPEAEVTRLKNRLEEIKTLDKHQLSATEKKALRMEVREIKKNLATMSGGVYLSVGGILLIALLLILLL